MLRPALSRRPFNLLLVGPPASGKRTLASSLLKNRNVFYSINVAESLPKKALKRVDFIILFVDMTNANSLVLINQLLEHMSPKFLSTKVTIVATKADLTQSWSFESTELESIVKAFYDLHIFYANLTVKKDYCEYGISYILYNLEYYRMQNSV
ncbi:unnamed protein product [Rhizopus stolonifer]